MADEQDLKQAQAVYKSLCEMLTEKDWNYDKDDESLLIESGVTGEDLPISFRIKVDADRMLVTFISPLPFNIPEERRKAMAVAVSAANYGMVDGSFDYDYVNGNMLFRLTTCFRECLIGKDLFEYVLYCACLTVDKYNDKFLLVAKSDMDCDEAYKFISGN